MTAVQDRNRDADTEYPRGTVTFRCTDIEGSTLRWEQDAAAMEEAVEPRQQDASRRAGGGRVIGGVRRWRLV